MSSESPRPTPEREDPFQIATGMTLADISIRNHVFAWILMFALIGFGLLTFTGFGTVFKGLGISQNPDVDFPVVNVSVTWEGASPEIIETDVVDILEEVVTAVEGVKEVSSTSRQGAANISVEFELEREIDVAMQDIQSKISQAQNRLPRGIDPAIVSKSNPEDEPIMRLALAGSRPPTFVADYIRNVIRPQLQTIPGIGEIQLQGFRDRSVRVWYDAVRLEAQGLTVQDVNNAIQREHLEVPAGRIESATREMNVRAEGEAIDLEGFRNLVLTYRDGAPVRLKDVAVVEDGLEDRRRIYRAMGEPAVGFGVTKLRGANAVQLGRAVRAKVAEIGKQLPEGLFIVINFDTTLFVERAIEEILFTLVMAALLTSLVCWVFLGSWSTTLNVLLAIPTSILGTFIVMYVLGFTLNTYTVLGLTLVVGIVVDDAIMVLENIYRHREHGEGKVKAASVGAREITFAAAAATAAIVAIFMPVAFMKGIIGKFFFQFGVTISVAVLISLLEALTLAPMRLSRMLEVGERATRLEKAVNMGFARLAAGYQRLLVPALHHRKLVLVVAAALFVASLGIVRLLRQEFVPVQDMSRFGIRFQTPVGSSLETSERVLDEIERFLVTRPEVDLYGGFVGGFGGGEVNSGFVFVTMKERNERPIDAKTGRRLSQMELMGIARQATSGITGARIVMQDFSQRGFSAGPRGRRLPGRVQHPRPRLGRARARLARDPGEDARVGTRDRRRQRLSGRDARGAGRPRPEQSGRPGDLDGRDRRDRSTRRSAASASASSRTRDGASTSACACWRSSASGPRTSAGCWCAPAAAGWCGSATSCASTSGPRCRRSPAATASARSRSAPTWRPASRSPWRSTGRSRSRTRCCPRTTGRCPPAPRAPSARPSTRCCSRWGSGCWSPTWCWRRSSTPSPTRSRCCWRCPSASAAPCSLSGSEARASTSTACSG